MTEYFCDVQRLIFYLFVSLFIGGMAQINVSQDVLQQM